MERSRLRRASALAIAMVVGAGTVLLGAGPAAAGKRQPAGSYTATFPDTSTTSPLVITNATGSTTSGTFALSTPGDYGTWVAQGTTVAFVIASSGSGHQGAVMIGKLTASGFSPGVIAQPGVGVHPWSATRVSGGSTSDAATTPRATERFAAKGTAYDAVFNGAIADTLTMTKDTVSKAEGTFTLTTLADTGSWTKLGKKMVLGVTNGGDAGIVLIGTQTASGISSSAAPGVYYQPGNGVYPWYATKPA